MCQLVETVKINNNVICDIEYHNQRFNNSRKSLFKSKDILDLQQSIQLNKNYKGKIIKCRIVYKSNIEKIEYHEYKKRIINTLKLVESNIISYSYKFEDKSSINNLLNYKNGYDDILIVKKGYITDTSFSNVIFYDGNKWFTPLQPLLKGTKREKLIDQGKVLPAKIKLKDLRLFKKAMLINSMLDLEDNITINIENIRP